MMNEGDRSNAARFQGSLASWAKRETSLQQQRKIDSKSMDEFRFSAVVYVPVLDLSLF